MTNELSKERAIEALYTVRAYYASLTAGYPKGKDCRGIGDVMCSEIANSCLMAIKALEQEPCEDCISRTEAIKIVNDMLMGEANHKIKALEQIQDLPSVTLKFTDAEIQKMQDLEQAQLDKAYELGAEQTRWIPVAERLPEKSGKYLVTVKNGNVYAGTYDAFSGKFQCAATAWQPLPTPYNP